jgi:predicted glycogen debranching enzyme
MDARVEGKPVTARMGKPVEVNALWVSVLCGLVALQDHIGADSGATRALHAAARRSFPLRFVRAEGGGLYDVVDGPGGNDASLRPNQLLAVSLPDAPISEPAVVQEVVRAVAALVTPLGLRSLDPGDPSYKPVHRGGPAQRDSAYHQGTVWPWLIGPYMEACKKSGQVLPLLLDALVDHLGEWGLGSVSETADGAEPHQATGCPFQAWSVAELIRARGLI